MGSVFLDYYRMHAKTIRKIVLVIALVSIVYFSTVLLAIVITKPTFSQRPQDHPFDVQVGNDQLRKEALTFVRDIVGLDYLKYKGTSGNGTKSISYVLSYGSSLPTGENEVFVGYAKTNGSVTFSISTQKGTLLFLQGNESIVNQVKGIIERYQAAYNTSYTRQMRISLDTVTTVTNDTRSLGDVGMQISRQIANDTDTRRRNEVHVYETFTWSRAVNGIPNSFDTVSITFKDGKFNLFSDQWNRYDIANANVNIDKQEAIRIAKERVTQINYIADAPVSNVTMVDSSISATLSFQPESSKLYPIWEVHGNLDKVYSGGVSYTIIEVRADTGEVGTVLLPAPFPPN